MLFKQTQSFNSVSSNSYHSYILLRHPFLVLIAYFHKIHFNIILPYPISSGHFPDSFFISPNIFLRTLFSDICNLFLALNERRAHAMNRTHIDITFLLRVTWVTAALMSGHFLPMHPMYQEYKYLHMQHKKCLKLECKLFGVRELYCLFILAVVCCRGVIFTTVHSASDWDDVPHPNIQKCFPYHWRTYSTDQGATAFSA